ncbi:MAG: transcriptional repressor LexA [Spirochaetia bacterium]|nr:transcriptional repressor LexA [Spirochaetia bacterium]
MKDLTLRQKEILNFIHEYIQTNNYPPTVRETARAFSISVKGAYDHLKALEKKGHIKTSEKRSRSIELIAPPQGDAPVIQIPLLGEIAAGRPIFADENFERTIAIPADLVANRVPHFAVRVKGDSMIGAGILSGDIAIIEQCETAQNGDIVVALLEENVTLKRFFIENNRYRLQAENPRYAPIYTQDLRILGRLRGIYRSY